VERSTELVDPLGSMRRGRVESLKALKRLDFTEGCGGDAVCAAVCAAGRREDTHAFLEMDDTAVVRGAGV